MLTWHKNWCKFVPNSKKSASSLKKIYANKVPKGAGIKMHKCLVRLRKKITWVWIKGWVGIFIFRIKGITLSIRTFSTIPEKNISSKHQPDNPRLKK